MAFQNRSDTVLILYLILRSAKESGLPIAEIEDATIESFYEENRDLYTSFEISKVQRLWPLQETGWKRIREA